MEFRGREEGAWWGCFPRMMHGPGVRFHPPDFPFRGSRAGAMALALPTRGCSDTGSPGDASHPSLTQQGIMSLQTWQRQLEKPVQLHSSTSSSGNWGREARGNSAHRGGKEAVSGRRRTWLLFLCQVSDDRGKGNEGNEQDQALCQPAGHSPEEKDTRGCRRGGRCSR